MHKETYTELEMKIFEFENSDVITESDEFPPDQ